MSNAAFSLSLSLYTRFLLKIAKGGGREGEGGGGGGKNIAIIIIIVLGQWQIERSEHTSNP